jgi:hypothetical protein
MSIDPKAPVVKSYFLSTNAKWTPMVSWVLPLLIFNLSLLTVQSCGLDIEDPTPPSPPIWVQKSLPEEWPERGIDAHESGGLILEWEANVELGIKAYLIHRAEYFEENDSLGDYLLISKFERDIGGDLKYLDAEVSLGTMYYYKLKAEDSSENTSAYSDSIGYSLLPQISISTMRPNGLLDTLSENMNLLWAYPNNLEMEDYCLTLLTGTGNFVIRKIFSPGNYVNDTESWIIPTSLILDPGQVYRWRIDTGARYVAGMETAASESPWATFLYIGE